MELTTDIDLKFKKASLIFRAYRHKLRKQILEYLMENEKTVTEVYVKFRFEQSVASQHLAILRRAGLVKTRRDGKYIYYSVDTDRIKQYIDVTDKLLEVSKKNVCPEIKAYEGPVCCE